MGVVLDLNAARQKRWDNGNTIMVQPCKGGFEVTLITCTGHYYWLGTREHFDDARALAHNEAFKAGRCKVRLLDKIANSD